MSAEEDLDGFLTVEGPLLETTYAALCVARGETVAPRYQTLGVFHDFLVNQPNGYVFGECLGEPVVSARKIALFREAVLTLRDRLRTAGDRPLLEARVVSMTNPEEWSAETGAAYAALQRDLAAAGIELKFVGPKAVIYALISSSILGLSLVDNQMFFVGPGEWAVRYNPAVSRFEIGGSSIDFRAFRALPQSFVPREYWSPSYRALYEQYASFSGSPMPEWFEWDAAHRVGVRWRSGAQMKQAVLRATVDAEQPLVYEAEEGFITRAAAARRPFYAVNLVFHEAVIDQEDASGIEVAREELLEAARKERRLAEPYDLATRIFTDTVTFSYSYWTKAPFHDPRGGVAYTEVHRGEDVLLEALNEGVLGFRLNRGRLALSLAEGPDTLSLVKGGLHWEPEVRAAYPAVVRL